MAPTQGSGGAAFARAGLALLQRLPPETSHTLGLRALALSRRLWRTPPVPSALGVQVFGRRFAHPVGLAAGFDKNGAYVDALGALGFSHIEIGTVTPRPQPGNPRPRLFRLRGAAALVNRMGFNNEGAAHVAARLQRAAFRGVRGVSIGKNADTPLEGAAADYLACLRTLYGVADYFAINVSSPNTRGLRDLQNADALGGIVEPLQQERLKLAARHGQSVPLLVKISPDLDDEQLRALCRALIRHEVDGVIATNSSTDIAIPGIEPGSQPVGGVSGAPLTARALAVLKVLRAELGAGFPIVSVGGLMNATDVLARLDAGANLVQLYTGFVYRGPVLLTEILRSLELRQRPTHA